MELNHELRQRYADELELISMDTAEGDQLAQLYDVWSFPAVLAVDSEGKLHKSWTESKLPLINEVAYYLQTSR